MNNIFAAPYNEVLGIVRIIIYTFHISSAHHLLFSSIRLMGYERQKPHLRWCGGTNGERC